MGPRFGGGLFVCRPSFRMAGLMWRRHNWAMDEYMQANPVYAAVTMELGFSLETIVQNRTTPLPRVKPMTKRARHKLAQQQNRIMAGAGKE